MVGSRLSVVLTVAVENEAPPAGAEKYSDATIAQLTALGPYSREQAIEALAVSEGDVQRAAAYLLR